MIKEKEELPPIVSYLINHISDKSVNVFHRQTFRDRLADMASIMNQAVSQFDLEYAKANSKPVQRKAA